MHMQLGPDQNTKFVLGTGKGGLGVDIQYAAMSNGGALITGPAAEAEAIALEIHNRGLRKRRPFVAVDCDDPDCLRVLDEEAAGGTLLLRDVDRLSPFLQQTLLARITDRRWRIIASARQCPSVTLDPRLFYYLNMVYIILEAPS